ncbi:glycosyltransferase 87 family protein [Nostocoides sp. HKS02]|uniref:glycosyltransferase 87 family protein n=1 Tax=Nostocoides sp. HKS02 TaxID=1813880 RepID=UPI0012B4CCEE|nr:glycosyltransferase 87 family protein [Tetrasphaera sp. HKS02]QGN58662.1 DUF2029 domain-containing protein [Tetrasphaera sp. HKS02]
MTRSTDPLSRGSLAFAGGPLGRHASGRAASWLATLVPLLVATALTMALSVVERAHCIQQGWTGSDQFWHGCFSDLPALYQLGHLHRGLSGYVAGSGVTSDHPVLTGSVMAMLGGLVPNGTLLGQTRWYFGLWAVVGVVLALAVVWFVAASRPRHVADAAQVALSPVLLMTALISADLFGVALVSAGIWAWGRRRPVLAGALLGLAVSARVYPLLVLLALVLLGARAGRLASVGRALAAAAGAVIVVLLPFVVGHPSAILRFLQVWLDSAAGLGSLWMLPQLMTGKVLPAGAVTVLAILGLVLAVLAGCLFAWSTPRRPTLAEVSLVLVALALVTGKSFPVQSSLWLVPLVALCGLRWRDHLLWAGAEALHFVTVWLYVGGLSRPERGLPAGWYAVFLVLRLIGVGYLAWRVWRTATQRDGERDDERDDELDELAGDLGDAQDTPDRFVVRVG